MRRAAFALAMFTFPIGAMAWIGCSSDSSSPSAITVADPGGTYGAEVQIVVSGRGSVQSAGGDIKCPGSCFAKYIFESAVADGATGGIALKAIPTQGASFKGWHFDTSPAGASGRGPDNCNPIQRPGSDPGATTQADVNLPFGQTNGTPPVGQEAACAAYTSVPLIYRLTATFDPDLPPVDSGADAGPSEILYQPVGITTKAYNLGLTSSNYLYWTFEGTSGTGVAFGSFPSGSAPQSPITVSSLSGSNVVTTFRVDSYGVVYQTPSALYAVRSGSTSATQVGSAVVPSCTGGVAMDSSNNVYCRTSSTILRWLSSSSYLTQDTLFTSVPSGNGLVAEVSSGAIVIGTTSAIANLGAFLGPDAGVAAPTTIAPATAPTVLRYNSSHYWWLDITGEFEVSSSKAIGSTASDTGLTPSTTYAYFSSDPNNSSYYWVANGNAIYRVTAPLGIATAPKTFRSGINITGLAVDSQYVYWGDGDDGTIRRASHTGF
jgi:hypothetical protein